MRKNWAYKKIGDVLQTTSGGTPSKEHEEYYGGTIPWLRSGEVSNRNITGTELQISDLGMNNSSAKWVPKDSVVIAMYGATVGQVGILRIPATTNQAVCSILPDESFVPDFIYYFLLSQKPHYLKLAVGGAQPNISQQVIKQTHIPVPSILEQELVVSELDLLSGIIDKQKQQLKELDILAQSVFYDMFGDPVENEKDWMTKTLNDVMTLYNGRAYKQDELLNSGRYAVLRVGNFFSTKDYYYSDLELEEDKYCDNGDLLYAWSCSFGARIWNGGKVIYHYHIWKVVIDELLLNKLYSLYLLNTITHSLMGNTHGATMVHLTKGGMERIEIPVPPLELQNSFAQKIQAIERQKESINKSLEDTQKLFDYTMDKYFG